MTLFQTPRLPDYKAKAAPIFWEPVMGSGERIAAMIAAVGDNGQCTAIQILNPGTLRALFSAQGSAAGNVLSFACSTLKHHLEFGHPIEAWESPFSGFTIGPTGDYLGSDLQDVVEQVKSLYSAFAHYTAEEDDTDAFRSMDNETLRSQVSDIIRQRTDLEAGKLLTQNGKLEVLDSGRRHWLDIPLHTGSQAGTIVSAWYKSIGTIETHVLRAQSNLTAVRSRKVRDRAVFIGRPFAGLPKPQLGKVDDFLDEMSWRLSQSGISVQIEDSADKLAEGVLEWAHH